MMRPADLEQEIEALGRLNLAGLRRVWEAQFGAAPKLRSPDLLRQLLAWLMQAAAQGGIDRDTRRRLTGRGPVEVEGYHLGQGAILRRDWQRWRIEAVVEAGGFRWEGVLYPSLSAVARAVTGTRWNGPRFFGLREDGA